MGQLRGFGALALLAAVVGGVPIGPAGAAKAVRTTPLTVEVDHFFSPGASPAFGVRLVVEGRTHACLGAIYTSVAVTGTEPNAVDGLREALSCPNFGVSHLLDGRRWLPDGVQSYSELRVHVSTTHHYLCTPEPQTTKGTTKTAAGYYDWTRWHCRATVL